VIIYNTLASRYGVNETTKEIIYPSDKNDYDCDYGRDSVAMGTITLPYGDDVTGNDEVMKKVGAGMPQCASQRALLTGKIENGMAEACCAWDLHIWLYKDSELEKEEGTSVTIPAVFITMAQADDVLSIMKNSQGNTTVELYQRWRPEYNVSALLIWAVGVLVAWLASYLSAGELRAKKKLLTGGQPRARRRPSRDAMLSAVSSEVEVERQRSAASSRGSGNTSGAVAGSSGVTEMVTPRGGGGGAAVASQGQEPEEEQVELTMIHAIVFIVFASASLFILFFFQIYNVVKIMYAFGCSNAMAMVIFRPFYAKISYKFFPEKCIHGAICTIRHCDIGSISYLDFFSSLTAYIVGGVWLTIAFTTSSPDQNLFFWVTQDIMGGCICIMFLSVIKLNRLQVATVLLGVAFFYDIFFVFITPYIFKGESVMITVATSGGPPTADPTWCEKYPKSDGCQGGDPLPMLFTIPRLFDYQGGSSLLGLGDIVLPGLLLSFGARLDEAKCLIGLSRGGRGRLNNGDGSCPNGDNKCAGPCRGYFCPLVLAYALGLIMANAAVYLMQMGQPALLYLVPLCLGTMGFQGYWRGEFWDLWNGPKVLMAAERFGTDPHQRVEEVAVEAGEIGNEMTSVDDRRSIT